MDKKHELTEKLRVIETEIHDAKTDMECINRKLNIAYQYEDDLVQRQVAAKKKTEELRQEIFKKSLDLSDLYSDMKTVFDVFTGNFYKH